MTQHPESRLPRFLAAGTSALVVEFGSEVDEAVNDAVLALDEAVRAARWDGVVELVPTYRSLLIHFDPAATSSARLKERLSSHLARPATSRREMRTWSLPVCYGGACGMDLQAVADLHGLTPEEVIAIHSSSPFRVYMIGFAPGFAYLGGLDPRLHTDRRAEPRLRTPPRSVSIGGAQSAVYPPFALPSGWHMLGQTPVRVYDPARREQPFLLAAGDRVRLRPIGFAQYEALCARADEGEIVATLEVGDGAP